MERYEIFVSKKGSDLNEATKEKPLKTIMAALKMAKGFEKESIKTIYIGEGTYVIDQTLDFGNDLKNIELISDFKKRASISSGKKIQGRWKKAENMDNVYFIETPEIEDTRHVYINGRKAQRAKSQTKKSEGWKLLEDPEMIFYKEVEKVETYVGEHIVYDGYLALNDDLLNLKYPNDLEFVYDVGWTHCVCPVEKVEKCDEGVFIKMKNPAFRDCLIKPGVKIGTPNYMENALEFLTQPGYWYFDKYEKILYYMPLEDEDIESLEVIVPCLENLVSISGSLDNMAGNISFENIDFIYTTWTGPSNEGYAEIQANLIKDPNEDVILHSAFKKVPCGLMIDAAENILFEKCRFMHMGSSGIDFNNGSTNSLVRGCEFFEIAGSGVQIGGFTMNDAHPDDQRKTVNNITVSDCLMHKIGTEYKGGIPIVVGYADSITLIHNEIFDVSYSGISVGWGWGMFDEHVLERTFRFTPEIYPKFNKRASACRNRIEFNHVYDAMKVLHDGAGIYTLGMQPGSIIRGNLVHDNGLYDGVDYEKGILKASRIENREDFLATAAKHGWPGGIYMDEATGGFVVTDNIVYNVVVPLFYHNVGMDGVFKTNHIYQNYFNVKPEDTDFPIDIASKAGIRKDYKDIFND